MKLKLKLHKRYRTRYDKETMLVMHVPWYNPKYWSGARFRDMDGKYRDDKGAVVKAKHTFSDIDLDYID